LGQILFSNLNHSKSHNIIAVVINLYSTAVFVSSTCIATEAANEASESAKEAIKFASNAEKEVRAASALQRHPVEKH
jgi:F0F1-type ATP synthase epsilon subunit